MKFVNECVFVYICDLLVINFDCDFIDISEVEVLENLFLCFDIVVMLIGVLSFEVYEVLVIVMNCLGG